MGGVLLFLMRWRVFLLTRIRVWVRGRYALYVVCAGIRVSILTTPLL